MNKILITGGSGFIGSALIRKFTQNDQNAILSIDNYSVGTELNHICHPSVQYIRCDTNDILENKQVNDFEPNIVYHLGEYSRITSSFDDIRICQRSNGSGTFCVLEYCRQQGAKLVYAGSSSKFGNNGADEHLSPYAWWKSKNIELINNYHQWWGLDFSIAYFYNVYGPGQISSGRMAAVIGLFQEQYLKGLPLTVVMPGTQRRDFTHIDDIVNGFILVGERGSGDGYLVGTGINYTLREIAEAFGTDIKYIPERRGERFTSRAYSTKMKEEFNWEAKHNVIDYIHDWVKEQKGCTT